MLIQKLKCPYGCENSVFTESVKTVENVNSNLLLEDNKSSVTERIVVHSCNCCGNSFETKEQNDGRMVL